MKKRTPLAIIFLIFLGAAGYFVTTKNGDEKIENLTESGIISSAEDEGGEEEDDLDMATTGAAPGSWSSNEYKRYMKQCRKRSSKRIGEALKDEQHLEEYCHCLAAKSAQKYKSALQIITHQREYKKWIVKVKEDCI